MSNITQITTPVSGGTADNQVADLIRSVGAKVRTLREERGIPRRLLSERSGVSPRYLAQLETGEGNISIGLLMRIAIALDQPIEAFFGIAPNRETSANGIDALYHRAGKDVQAAVLRLLAGDEQAQTRAARICLVGLRGAGKSTLGAKMGELFDIPFIELNKDIEHHSGMPVSEVMALYGQEGYRHLEASAVERVVAMNERVILAVAGGIVAEPDTYSALLAHFHTIWIKTSPEEHMARVRAQGDERPMAGNPEAMEQLKSILTDREHLYSQAEAQIDTSGKPLETSVHELATLIRNRGFLG